MTHLGHLNELAVKAAKLYGQDWGEIPGWTRDSWREAVRHAKPNTVGNTDQEKCAIKAVEAWYAERQPQAEAETESSKKTAKTKK
jgi:hypothetical protein